MFTSSRRRLAAWSLIGVAAALLPVAASAAPLCNLRSPMRYFMAQDAKTTMDQVYYGLQMNSDGELMPAFYAKYGNVPRELAIKRSGPQLANTESWDLFACQFGYCNLYKGIVRCDCFVGCVLR